MTARTAGTGASGHRASRRHFFKMLAGSPLLALMYPALSPRWQRAIDRELRCSSCGGSVVFAQTSGAPARVPGALESHLTGQVVETADEAINVWDFEQVAHANNLPEHWSYIHMGVDDFETRKANREGFQRLVLRPRRLGPDVAKLDTSVELFGRRWDTPLFLCPVAALEAYHTEGESGAARAARARGVLQMQSHVSSQSYETIAAARGEPHWFQLYANADWDATRKILDRVAKAGCPVVVWTIDLLGGSNRELSRRAQGRDGYDRPLCQNCHNHQKGYQRPMNRDIQGPPGPRPPFDWDYVKRLKDATPMKVVLKGIVTREEAELAVANGADGIFVSNHGGRAENSLRSTIDSLPEVVAAVKGRAPVFLDSGVRRGADIFKALALGADAVGIGRPYVWGLGAFGQQGVDKVIALLLDEFRMVMRQTRTTSLDQIGSQFVMPGQAPVMMRSNDLGFGL
jgi:4-hydroxymandelate oxidase